MKFLNLKLIQHLYKNQKVLFLVMFLFIWPLMVKSQNQIELIIKDSTTNELLEGVNVGIKGTNSGAITDKNGYAKIINIPDGKQLLTINMIGYKASEQEIVFPFQKGNLPLTILLSVENEKVDEVIISATRNNSRIEDLPTKIEVLGIEEIQEENSIKPGNIASILGDIGGIQMQQTSASSGNLNARIQGLNGRYSQVLKDGMPLYSGFSGSFSILQVPPLDLKQIEIIKGSASTLFGGDAIGGIINLVSKTPGKPETDFMINQTTLKETDVNTYISRNYKKCGFTFFAGYVLQKAVDVNNDGFSDVPDFNNIVIHPKLFFYPDKNTTISAGYNGTFEDRTGGDMDVIKNGQNIQHQYFVNQGTMRNSFEINFSRKMANSSELSFKGSSGLVNRNIKTMEYDFKANQDLYYTELGYLLKKEKVDFVFGVNFNGDIFTKTQADSVEIPDYKYSTTGLFAQNDWRVTKKLLIESGLRYDIHSDKGNFLLPRLSLMYKIIPELSVRLNGGLGYKIPVAFGYIDEETDLKRIHANQLDLKTETSQGVNFDVNYNAILWRTISLTFNQSFFYTQLNNPVVYATNANLVELSNASKPVETKGLQSYVRLSYEELELYLSYIYTHCEKKYDASNPWFLATPQHNFAATLAFEPNEKWRMGIESSLIGKQYIENNKKTPSYLFLAVMIQRNIKKVAIVLNCENLLDYRQKDFLIPPVANPSFKTIWAPIDGRVINLSVNLRF